MRRRLWGVLTRAVARGLARKPRRVPARLDTQSPGRPLVQRHGSRAAGLQRAIPCIEAHHDIHSIFGQVAREAGMSKLHYCLCFLEVTGQALYDYLAQLGLTHAL